MKRLVSMLVLGVCLVTGPVVGYSLGKNEVIAKLVPTVAVVADGRNIDTSRSAPIEYKGSIYLPVRAVSEAVGYEVNWDNKNSKVDLTLPKDAYPLVKNDAVELIATSASPQASTTQFGYYRIYLGLNFLRDLERKVVVVVDILDPNNRVVSSKIFNLADMEAGSHNYDLWTDSMQFSFKATTNAEALSKMAEYYSYRVTIK